jgi:hypothetical protein
MAYSACIGPFKDNCHTNGGDEKNIEEVPEKVLLFS